MVNLKAARDALKTVSIVCGMIPVVGDNLKSAVELASTICEQVQTIKENSEGYEQLGVQVADLITAVASVLQQSKQDAALERAMQANVGGLLEVLEEIKVAVDNRLRSDPKPVRNRDRLFASIRKKAKDTKGRYSDQDVVEKMHRKLKEVVERFSVSSLLRSELSALQTGSNLDAVRALATRIYELQVQQDSKRDAEAERTKRDADIALLESLRPVTSAAWNATGAGGAASALEMTVSTCTPGTRVSILSDLSTWAGASDSPCVFWLNGLAGTGKSTIARTFCDRSNDQGLLGASFFISRDQQERRDASNMVRTIAHQLAVRWRPVSDALCAKLRESPISTARSLQEQIVDFIIIPARELPGNASFVIVIDALDEAFSDFLGRPGGDLLLLLGRQLLQLAGRVRLFITSRNEIPILQMFQELSAASHKAVKLHDLDKAVVQADIATYLMSSFTNIRKVRLELVLGDWPTTEAVDQLVQLSGLLFIYAATAVRYMNERKHSPRDRLAQLLGQRQKNTRTSPYAQLDGLYQQVLSDAVRDSGDDEEFLCQRLHAVMAVIVLAQTPLNLEALSILSGVDPDGTSIVVGSLLSLLADSTSGVRVFHPSLLDFAIDAARCTDPRLCVVPSADHGEIALRCLELMNKHLRYNICGIQDLTVANEEVTQLDMVIRENVSDALHYAACFWCTHVAASGSPGSLLLNALDEFCRTHLFHWIEILSLTKHVASAETALPEVIEWCQKIPNKSTTYASDLLQDLARALRIFAIPIRSHALHAYHSAFVSMPQCLLLETLAQGHLPSGLPQLVSPRAARWGPSRRVLEGHSGAVHCVAYLPDGSRIVSTSEDCTVRIWNAVTFERLATLVDHKGSITALAVSPDGTHILAGSCVWNAVTFEQLAELKDHLGMMRTVVFSPDGRHIVSAGHTVHSLNAVTYEQLKCVEFGYRTAVVSVAFSPDGKHIVLGASDYTVHVWNAVTFERLAKLKGHVNYVDSVAFSPDGTHIISGAGSWNTSSLRSKDYALRVWNAVTLELLAELEGHTYGISSVAYSPDGTHIVSGSNDCTVRVWNAVTFEQLAELKGHQRGVTSVAFSPDNTHIVSGSDDCTVSVWNAVNFERFANLEGHTSKIKSVAFSLDGTHIVSGSTDHTVCVWNIVTFAQIAELLGHTGGVYSVAFSPDGTHVVSGSNDDTVRVWKVVTSEQLAELKGHTNAIRSVVFSPDGTHIVSGSHDGTVRVWNAVTFEQIAKLNGRERPVSSVAFSHENQVIMSHYAAGGQDSWVSSNNDFANWTMISPTELPSSITSTARPPETTVTLSDSGWLSCLYEGRRILVWLPVERRGKVFAGHGRRVVVGARSGAVTVLELPTAHA